MARNGMGRRDLPAIPFAPAKVGRPKSIRAVILGGADVIQKMDELEAGLHSHVPDYAEAWGQLRAWLAARSA